MTREEADIVVSYIEALEERVNHQSLMRKLEADGYSESEIDEALNALGEMCGRDCGIK